MPLAELEYQAALCQTDCQEIEAQLEAARAADERKKRRDAMKASHCPRGLIDVDERWGKRRIHKGCVKSLREVFW